MMFRTQGKRIQCLRSEYNPEKKRTQGKLIATLEKNQSTVPEEVSQKLTKKEVDQLQNYLSERIDKTTVDGLESILSTSVYVISQITEALKHEAVDNDKHLSGDAGSKLYDAIKELRKELKRAGYKAGTPPKRKTDKSQTELNV